MLKQLRDLMDKVSASRSIPSELRSAVEQARGHRREVPRGRRDRARWPAEVEQVAVSQHTVIGRAPTVLPAPAEAAATVAADPSAAWAAATSQAPPAFAPAGDAAETSAMNLSAFPLTGSAGLAEDSETTVLPSGTPPSSPSAGPAAAPPPLPQEPPAVTPAQRTAMERPTAPMTAPPIPPPPPQQQTTASIRRAAEASRARAAAYR